MVPTSGFNNYPSVAVWYSYKFNGPGLRYEVGLCILTGRIVWVHGPIPPGGWNDLQIFRHSLVTHLGQGERVETDRGYRGEYPQRGRIPDPTEPVGVCASVSAKDTKQSIKGSNSSSTRRMCGIIPSLSTLQLFVLLL